MMLKVTLPYPPQSNNLYPTGRHGKRFLSREGKEVKAEIADIVEQELIRLNFLFDESKDVIINFYFFMPDKRRRDVQNLHKTLCDGISEAIGIDDCNFLCRDMSKQVDRENPRVEVEIWQE